MRQQNPIPSGRGFVDYVYWLATNDAFEALFGTENACRDFLFKKRWPEGFRCTGERCSGKTYTWLTSKFLRCGRCQRKISLTAKTILHRTRKDLLPWFRAAFVLAQRGGSATRVAAVCRLTYKVAWTWCQKIRAVMASGTTLGSPFPPFGSESDRLFGRYHVPGYQRYFAQNGHFQWHAETPEELGTCCRRFDKRDWTPDRDSEYADERWANTGERNSYGLPAAKLDLFRAYSGSISDKHLRAYLTESEFRRNYRAFNPAQTAAVIAGRFGATPPRPYREIVGPQATRPVVCLKSPRPGLIPAPPGMPTH